MPEPRDYIRDYIRDGAEIYRRSFAIIRSEAELGRFDAVEERVAVRLIHACGMPEVASDIVMSPTFARVARQALRDGAPIFCDARMVANGVTRARLPADNDVVCTLGDPSVPDLARRLGNTRSAAAMELWRDRLGGSVVAIGNAPTALFRLLEMFDAGAPLPAAIVGLPVGFVGAAESKEALALNARVPFLIVRGRKGGSAMTAAALNALASDIEWTSLDLLAGAAEGGTLYGIGVGPGDVRYLTLRAAGLVRSVDVLAFFAKRGALGNARRIVAPLREDGRCELRLEYPVTDEIPAEHPDYQGQMAGFYREAAASLAVVLKDGKSVGLIAEGDPFFYGSFMHMWRRLATDFPVEVVPGVTGMSGCWTRANLPITWGNDTLAVLPGTLAEQALVDRLRQTDAAVIMKVGRNLGKVRRAVEAAGLLSRAVYVERGTMQDERILPLAECGEAAGAYFAMILIPGQGRRL